MMKQLEVQKLQPNISNYQLKTIQQELVLIQVAKKGHIRKKFISVSSVMYMYEDTSLSMDRFLPNQIWHRDM